MTRILAIDDEPAILQAMGDYLEHFGFDVSTYAYTGAAVENFSAFCEDLPERPDIIIVDYRLPGDMNGTQVVEEMHRILGGNIPAILFTGDISKKTIGDAEAGDLHLLYKPVRMEKLRQTVEEILGLPSRTKPS